MKVTASANDIERFRDAVARRLGLQFDDSKLAFLAEVLKRRVEAGRQTTEQYLCALDSLESCGGETGALAAELTVAETYFFRNQEQFRAFAESVLPSLTTAHRHAKKLRILVAGCASGEEAFTLAIILRGETAGQSWNASIRAADVNPKMIQKARKGLYSAWSLRETPPEIRRRWFAQEGGDFLLGDAVRERVAFEERNLADDDRDLWKPDSYDVVFCRNVLMYFTPERAMDLVKRITRAIVPGGYLFLGHAETLRGLSNEFNLLHTHGTFYYRRRASSKAEASQQTSPAENLPSPVWPALPALVEGSGTWVETIQGATARIEALAETLRESSLSRSSAPPPAMPAWDLGGSLELLRKERFADALNLLLSLPAESSHDPEVLLLRAVLLTQSGQFDLAESVCGELLEIDELNGGAHYLLALCREAAGDGSGAIEHDQIAAYLNPNFAMPRLHLGLLSRNAGSLADASAEFAQAMLLLQREDTSRLLLFGGGFGRNALIGLCRAEIAACGGQQ